MEVTGAVKNLLPEENVTYAVFTALGIARSIARLSVRPATINDVTSALGILCFLPIPFKPGLDEKTMQPAAQIRWVLLKGSAERHDISVTMGRVAMDKWQLRIIVYCDRIDVNICFLSNH